MKVILDLPDWCNEKHIYVLAGRELVAYKYLDPKPWMIKSSRCNLCGKCCQTFRGIINDAQIDEKGHCRHLKPDGDMLRCGLELSVPFGCIVSIGPYKKVPECTEKFESVK